MNFQEWTKVITDQIGCPAELSYGSFGSRYLHILIARKCPSNPELLEVFSIGEVPYSFYTDYQRSVPLELLVKFGKEAEKYRVGLRKSMPSLCFRPKDSNTNSEWVPSLS